MLWESITDACDVCQCSRMIRSGLGLSEKRCSAFHHDSYIDKENVQQQFGSPLKNESDISLYGSTSPGRSSCDSSSPSHCLHQRRRPFVDHDPNSQDSGYGASCPGDGKFFQYAKSLGVTPQPSNSPKSLSFGSMESMDDEFLDFSDLEPLDEESTLPKDFNKLITAPIASGQDMKKCSPRNCRSMRPPFRRSLSLTTEGCTPNSSRVRSCLFKPNIKDLADFRTFKRPEPPSELQSPVQNKRLRTAEEMCVAAVPKFSKPLLQRSMSATDESIEFALQRSSNEPDLIGDFSKSFCLPLISGRHQDLKSITSATLARLMTGLYTTSVASFKVIDCRYPYEFEGGHIQGAMNIYTKEQIMEELLDQKEGTVNLDCDGKRHILVFHCEFSSERGPTLSRFLRNWDRERNKDSYPALEYPEVYLLDGGYKSFYEQYADMCVPVSYKPMKHPEHEQDLRHFRAKSKTWNDNRSRQNYRSGGHKRLGFP